MNENITTAMYKRADRLPLPGNFTSVCAHVSLYIVVLEMGSDFAAD